MSPMPFQHASLTPQLVVSLDSDTFYPYMAVGHLLLKSFLANEAVFQMMMLSYNLFLLFKFDSLHISEYRQQIKTFRLKYVFLAGIIIRTTRYVVMKLPAKYPYKDVYENCLC